MCSYHFENALDDPAVAAKTREYVDAVNAKGGAEDQSHEYSQLLFLKLQLIIYFIDKYRGKHDWV